MQVLQADWDPTFSTASFGFRPGRSCHQAVTKAQEHVAAGCGIVVDIDLEKFFDRVNHDVLMDRLAKRIADAPVLRLIRHYLKAGVMMNGVVRERDEGTPQGGPLSPLLANVLLDEVDQELERRGHCFVRYADDCNVYVRSHRAGERVMDGLRQMYGALKLRMNESKSAVASAYERKFLGFSFYWHWRGDEVRRRVADPAMRKYKARIRHITRRSGGGSIGQVVEDLQGYVPGWKGYFQLSQTPWEFNALDQWMRHRLRALHLKQWKHGPRIYQALRRLGASERDASGAAASRRGYWRASEKLLSRLLPKAYFRALGVPTLS